MEFCYNAGMSDTPLEVIDAQGKPVTFHKSVTLAVIDLLKSMSEDERLQVFNAFCTHCGCVQPASQLRRCQCWNDE
jgi:Rieske Fe-S protein